MKRQFQKVITKSQAQTSTLADQQRFFFKPIVHSRTGINYQPWLIRRISSIYNSRLLPKIKASVSKHLSKVDGTKDSFGSFLPLSESPNCFHWWNHSHQLTNSEGHPCPVTFSTLKCVDMEWPPPLPKKKTNQTFYHRHVIVQGKVSLSNKANCSSYLVCVCVCVCVCVRLLSTFYQPTVNCCFIYTLSIVNHTPETPTALSQGTLKKTREKETWLAKKPVLIAFLNSFGWFGQKWWPVCVKRKRAFSLVMYVENSINDSSNLHAKAAESPTESLTGSPHRSVFGGSFLSNFTTSTFSGRTWGHSSCDGCKAQENMKQILKCTQIKNGMSAMYSTFSLVNNSEP